MTLDDLERLLTQHIGLDVESIGKQTLIRTVRERQAASGEEGPEAYCERVRRDATELQELVEALIVPETWFFRDREAFLTMGRELCESASAAVRPLRILSFPCSTGEEPYSAVMTLLDAGMAPESISVDAVDISERSLAHARDGLYRSNSFRGSQLAFRDRYFERTDAGYRISPTIRQRVTFRRGNLLRALEATSPAAYDVVFCRNVLIYFERAAQQAAMEALSGLLKPAGLLFVGPSETGLFLNGAFESVRAPLSFAFRKSAPRDPSERKSAQVTSRPVPAWTPPRPAAPRSSAPSKPAGVADAKAAEPASSLERASELADQGRLGEAAAQCLEHLRLHGPSGRAFHLLALVHEASGRVEAAVDCHRKALYLEPNHKEALLHLAFLLQMQGDTEAAERLRKRASRVGHGGGGP